METKSIYQKPAMQVYELKRRNGLLQASLINAKKATNAPNSIGAGGDNSTCGTVTIEEGAKVTQN